MNYKTIRINEDTFKILKKLKYETDKPYIQLIDEAIINLQQKMDDTSSRDNQKLKGAD